MNHDNHMLISALLNPSVYVHPTTKIELIETHISWVILTGTFVYKIKKPVCFQFLDFSTFEKRRYYCEEELRLNRRFAPQLYLETVSITGPIEEPEINGSGKVLETAVKMRQFSQHGLLETLAEKQQLTTDHIDELGVIVATFHRDTEVAAAGSEFGLPAGVKRWTDENFVQIQSAISKKTIRARLQALKNWCDREIDSQSPIIQARCKSGFVRECHGDLHLGNMAVIDGKVTLFDCIEFNPELRWIDVVSEAAFVMMDLQFRGYTDFSWRFINLYIQQSGDCEGLQLLRYFLIYRTLVRAKVVALKMSQNNLPEDAGSESWLAFQRYLDMAETWQNNARPAMILMFGFSGSGKSTVAKVLAEVLGGIQIRSDVERKRLYDLDVGASSRSGIDAGIYTSEATVKTYARLSLLSKKVVQAGYPAVVDATFHSRARRAEFEVLAKQLAVPFMVVECTASVAELHRRIHAREASGQDASEAGISVLEQQRQTCESLTPEEGSRMVSIDTENLPPRTALQSIVSDKLFA